MACLMTTKPETRFWKKLKECLSKVHWTRVESFSSPGVPDLHGVFKGKNGRSFSFWVELKCTKLKKIHLTPKQISWNFSYNRAGGNNFIMAEALGGRGVYIYSGAVVRELSVQGLDLSPLSIIQSPWNQDTILKILQRSADGKLHSPLPVNQIITR